MSNKQLRVIKWLAGTIALYGVWVVPVYEGHITNEHAVATYLILGLISISRFFLFMFGTTLPNDKHRQKSFVLSIILSVGYIAYIIIIQMTMEDPFEIHELALAILGAIALAFVEYVFSLLMETKELPIVVRLKGIIKTMWRQRDKYLRRNEEMRIQIELKQSDIEQMQEASEKMREEIRRLTTEMEAYSGVDLEVLESKAQMWDRVSILFDKPIRFGSDNYRRFLWSGSDKFSPNLYRFTGHGESKIELGDGTIVDIKEGDYVEHIR